MATLRQRMLDDMGIHTSPTTLLLSLNRSYAPMRHDAALLLRGALDWMEEF
jgi:hypothetical protein